MVGNGRLSRRLGLPNRFERPGWASYSEYAEEPTLISQTTVSLCKKCRKEITETPCDYCETNGTYTNETEKVIKYTLNSQSFGSLVAETLVKEGISEKTIAIDDTKDELCIILQSPSGFKVGLVFFKGTLIGEDTFRQTVSKMTDEKNADYLVFLCKQYDDSISKILNFYPYVRIDTFEISDGQPNLLRQHLDTFAALAQVRPKASSPIIYRASEITAAIENTKRLYDQIRSSGKSSMELGNEFEKQLIVVLNYLFTTFEIKSRDRLPEILIFDYTSGYYLVDIKSGMYKIGDYRQIESYAIAYFELLSERKKSIRVRGFIVPHILWSEKADAIADTFENFVKNYKPLANAGVQITLMDVDVILRLAEAKPTMSNNAFTHLVLNVDKLFIKGQLTNQQLDKIMAELDNTRGQINTSLEKSREKYIPSSESNRPSL